MKHVRGNCMRNCWGGGAWPGFETTRRAKLAARTARGRAATHRHTQRPDTTGVEDAGGTGGHGRASRSTTPSRKARSGRSRGRPGPTAPGTPVGPQATQAGRPPHTGTHSDQTPLVWRTPEGPEGTGRLRDRPLRAVRLACGDLAGGRARRRPEHPWGHKQHKQEGRRPRAHQAARPINTPRGARNASGTTSNTAQGRGPTGPRPRRYDSDANAQKY